MTDIFHTAPKVDYMADYAAAQAAGHHVDCDGYMTLHRTEIVRNAAGTFETHCETCGKLGIGSSSSRETQQAMHADHATETACDGRCKDWS